MLPVATKSKETIFSTKVSQGHNVIDLNVIWKGMIFSGVFWPSWCLHQRLAITQDENTRVAQLSIL